MSKYLTRIQWIDSLKGVLIILVVLGHVLQGFYADYTHNTLWRIIYSFHMPAFMAVSGFCCYKVSVKLSVIQRRFVQLMFPYLSWSIIRFFTSDYQLENMFLKPDSTYWFLYVLFVISIIHTFVIVVSERLSVSSEFMTLVIVCMLSAIMLVFNIRSFGFQFIAFHYTFYSVGWFVRKSQDKLFPIFLRRRWELITLFLISALFWNFHEAPSFMPRGSSLIYCHLYRYVVPLIAIPSLFAWFKYGNAKMLILNKLGGVTLGIYILHIALPSCLYDWLLPRVTFFYGVPYMAVRLFVLLVLSYFACRLLKLSKVTSKLLLGIK